MRDNDVVFQCSGAGLQSRTNWHMALQKKKPSFIFMTQSQLFTYIIQMKKKKHFQRIYIGICTN